MSGELRWGEVRQGEVREEWEREKRRDKMERKSIDIILIIMFVVIFSITGLRTKKKVIPFVHCSFSIPFINPSSLPFTPDPLVSLFLFFL